MNKIFSISTLALFLTSAAFAGVKVTSVELLTEGSTGFVNIKLDGRSNDLPDLKVVGSTIELTLSNAETFQSIVKNVRGAQLSANSLNGKAIIKAVLPYNVPSNAVDVAWRNADIQVVFPRGKVTESAYQGPAVTPKEIQNEVKKPLPVDKKIEQKVSKDLLNEDYLNKLMKDNKMEPEVAQPAVAKADQVNVKQASITKVASPVTPVKAKTANSNDHFSFAGYTAKFAIFLAIVLGLFYGIVQLLKKGVFSRGKLGFLNNSQLIEVLSTTYVAPKRSLLVVKAHKQIFLVANSENGLTFLSEMTDTSGLIKAGEKMVTGTNFDMNLEKADLTAAVESIVKLKENIHESTPVAEEKGLSKIAVAKDIVKFSDELKKKAKKLKPIEFN